MRSLIVVLAILAAGCSSASQAPPAHHQQPGAAPRPARTITARLVLPARTVAAGSSLSGRVIVQNDTGRAVHTTGCLGLFQVALVSPTYRPAVAWYTCLQFLTIPVGRSTYRVKVVADRNPCPQVSARTVRTCPLPPGDYHAVLYQVRHLVRRPAPLPVRVTPRR